MRDAAQRRLYEHRDTGPLSSAATAASSLAARASASAKRRSTVEEAGFAIGEAEFTRCGGGDC